MNKTINIYSLLLILFSVSGNSVCQAQAQAPVFYEVIGNISSLDNNLIRINDRVLKISPTVKVILKNKRPGNLSDLGSNDFVGIDLITINNKLLIDTIYILPQNLNKPENK